MYREISTFYDCEEFIIETEVAYLDGQPPEMFAHCTFSSFDKHSYSELLEQWEKLKTYASNVGFSQISSYTKNSSFVKRLGKPKSIKEMRYENERYEVWTWELTQ